MLKLHNVPAAETPLERQRRRDEAVRPLLTQMWADGDGWGVIAARCGIGRDAVKRLVKLWQLPPRAERPDRVPGGPRVGNVRPGRPERDAEDEPAHTRRIVPTLAEVLAMSEQSGALAGLR